jgi:hypothetical protein
MVPVLIGASLRESNKKNSKFMSEYGPLVRRAFESTPKK